ncbi:interferon-induced protein 44-like [Boleophthalmus pectinirostris]|uniref:interferon-induced protein 44-like n=1 Tax=Boleophthalmus pectinirostris TaxID=150288 RepID=UPI00242D16DB|nr:interferon-induced protein 44-like [Boleophthalmus pectinirostris]
MALLVTLPSNTDCTELMKLDLPEPTGPTRRTRACATSRLQGAGAVESCWSHVLLLCVQFRVDQALCSDTEGYIKRPGLREHMHCVAFVLDASKVSTCSDSTRVFLQQLRSFITDLGVHQVVLLTHVDKICNETQKDTSEVYKSIIVRQAMFKAAELVGMSPSSVVPVRNYWCELELDLSSDVLLLRALELLLQYTDLYYREQQRAPSKHEH